MTILINTTTNVFQKVGFMKWRENTANRVKEDKTLKSKIKIAAKPVITDKNVFQ